ncbi:Oxoglutarate/iron-dependent dioxygenase [Sesbania bispinosa]|nr:Oxoglutarate/iron-dependent dioxygenase [Sesbania bispinosa]
MVEACVPTVDLSPFLREDDEDGKKKVMEVITQAYEEKIKSSPSTNAPLPAGYNRQPLHSPDKNEYLLIFPPRSNFNVYPPNPPKFREVIEEMFVQMSKVGVLLENIINDCLGLPPNFLKEYNHDRSWDFMTALRYFPASTNENVGITEHEDGNIITFVLQDGVGGLQVLKNGHWIPVVPAEGTIVVNVGDVIQVLSNKKFKSATHRVVRSGVRNRYSYVFFHNLTGDTWVEPLPQFTKEIGEPPKYRGFLYKEYQELRMRNKTHPPSRPEDVIHITHYAIDN